MNESIKKYLEFLQSIKEKNHIAAVGKIIDEPYLTYNWRKYLELKYFPDYITIQKLAEYMNQDIINILSYYVDAKTYVYKKKLYKDIKTKFKIELKES